MSTLSLFVGDRRHYLYLYSKDAVAFQVSPERRMWIALVISSAGVKMIFVMVVLVKFY